MLIDVTLIERQKEREINDVTRGVTRYREMRLTSQEADTPPGIKMMVAIMEPLVAAVVSKQDEALSVMTSGPKTAGATAYAPWMSLILSLSAEKIAYITARTALSGQGSSHGKTDSGSPTVHSMANTISSAVKAEREFELWQDAEREKAKDAKANKEKAVDLFKLMTSRVKKIDPRTVKKWRKRAGDVDLDWTPADRVVFGAVLVDLLTTDTGGGWFKQKVIRRMQSNRFTDEKTVVLTEVADDFLNYHHAECELQRPWYSPLICPPKPWLSMHDGGYYIHRLALLKAGLNKHTAANPEGISPAVYEALNHVQNTAWAVNADVFAVMSAADENGDLIGDIPSANPDVLPEKMSDDAWLNLPKEEKTAYKMNLAQIHEGNAKAKSKRRGFRRLMMMARELAAEPRFWFCYAMDFRGRLYPVGQDLQPQGDDKAKALLTFAEGKPLSETSVWWLKVHVANTWANGIDKSDFDSRIAWVNENLEAIVECAANPLDGSRWWSHAENPWSFLAACFEMKGWVDHGTEFVSRLPISMDGSNNGLQHLAAMGRDPVGAKATNLMDSGSVEDIYMDVCGVANQIVEEDCVRPIPEDLDAKSRDAALRTREAALAWRSKITRKVVKRGVMTTPYGVTAHGIAQQLVADGHCDDVDGNKNVNAQYLKSVIIKALSATVVSAKEIMSYLQEVAEKLSAENFPLRWTTPLGFQVTQAYNEMALSRVRCMVGRINIWKEDSKLGLSKSRQSLASAPNVVHSMDACHLQLTTLMAKDNDITSLAFIHDSYGTLAADCDRLAVILRETFCDLYENRDWLEEFEKGIKSYAPDVELPARPGMGTFDLSLVREAPYFFA